jgi:hypothetical protein
MLVGHRGHPVHPPPGCPRKHGDTVHVHGAGVLAGIPHTIPVGIFLEWIKYRGTVITGIRDAVPIGILMVIITWTLVAGIATPGVPQPPYNRIIIKGIVNKRVTVIVRVGLILILDVPAVVTGISYTVIIGVFLIRVFYVRAVVSGIENSITVIII